MSISSNFPEVRPSLTLDFQKSEVVDPRITFTRNSIATRFNSYGNLETVSANTPRINFDPSTLLCEGFLSEVQRTNSIRNNTMVGAVAGTPGTAPTRWGISTTNAELGFNVAAVGVESGISYIDVRISGNVTSSRDMDINFEQINIIAAADNQTWAQSVFLREVGGTQGNISAIYVQSNVYTSGLIYISTPWFAAKTVTTAALATQRFSASATLSGATIAFIAPFLKVRTAASGAVDFTLRIGMPQLELGSHVSSVIPTSTIAITREKDEAVMTGTNFSSWFNSSEFTIVVTAKRGYSGNFLSYPNLLRINDGTSSNNIGFYGALSSTQFTNYAVKSSDVDQTDYVFRNISDTSTFKMVQSLKANNSTFGVNGTLTTTDTTVTMPIGMNRMVIGYDGSNEQWNGTIQRIDFYPQQLTSQQLQNLSRV